jgi:hypothetical protein
MFHVRIIFYEIYLSIVSTFYRQKFNNSDYIFD